MSPPLALDSKAIVRFLADENSTYLPLLELEETKKMKLEYSNMIIGLSDADWAGDNTDKESASGSVVFFSGNQVSCYSNKQSCATLLTSGAEY